MAAQLQPITAYTTDKKSHSIIITAFCLLKTSLIVSELINTCFDILPQDSLNFLLPTTTSCHHTCTNEDPSTDRCKTEGIIYFYLSPKRIAFWGSKYVYIHFYWFRPWVWQNGSVATPKVQPKTSFYLLFGDEEESSQIGPRPQTVAAASFYDSSLTILNTWFGTKWHILMF